MSVMRYVWAGPNTLLGLTLALLALRGGRLSVVQGVLEAHSPVLQWILQRLTPLAGGAAAITFGHVVLGVDADALEATRAHERVHVRQYERWGPFFIPAYLAAGLWTAVCGRHPYLENPFEHEARSKASRDTRKLYSDDAFRSSLSGTDGRLQSFVERRRRFLLNVTDPRPQLP